MKIKKFVTISLLLGLMVLAGGCHYGDDDHRDYGNNRYGSYRDGFRAGRAYERRNENWRDSRDADRDQWRRRWLGRDST
jgi:hypothetical protein